MADCPDVHSDLQPGYTIWYDCAHRTKITARMHKARLTLCVAIDYIILWSVLWDVIIRVMKCYNFGYNRALNILIISHKKIT